MKLKPLFTRANTTPIVCLARITMGGFLLHRILTTVPQENTMSRMLNAAIPVALFISALALSACATKTQEAAVAEPAPAAAVAPEAAPAPAVAAEQPAPLVAAAQPAPKPVVKKAKRKVAKAAPVEPVVAPAPVVKQEAPVAAPQEPTPPVVTAAPAPKPAEKGFLEQYWLWLVGIVIAVIAVLWMRKRD
jgi:hypothetical protein